MTDESKGPAIEDKNLQDIKRGPGTEITISPRLGAVTFENVANVITLGQVMARGGPAVPAHLRDHPGACTAVIFYASEWGMSPYAVATKTYVVKDVLCFESQLIRAVIELRAPIHEDTFNWEFTGEGVTRKCRCFAQCKVRGIIKVLEWWSPEIGKISPKNSPLWTTKPDLQLLYNTQRDWCRAHFPHLLLGAYSREELIDASPEFQAELAERAKDVTPATRFSGAANVATGEGYQQAHVENGLKEATAFDARAELAEIAADSPLGPAPAQQEPAAQTQTQPEEAKEEATPPPQTESEVTQDNKPAPESAPAQVVPPKEEPKPEPKPKEPKSREEYRVHATAWLEQARQEKWTVKEINERFNAERALRGKCMFVDQPMDDLRKLRDEVIVSVGGKI